jgi:xanthine dehydrogenase accessory factor
MNQAEFAKMMDTLASRGAPFAVATVVKTEGSSLGKPGFKVIISGAGEVVYGSLGGVCPESAIASAAKTTMRTGAPKMVKVYLENVEDAVGAVLKSQSEDEIHVETNCGGTMEIYIEPFLPQQRLVLIGQGGKDDVEDALVRLGKLLDFEVVVIDHAPVLGEQPDKLIKAPDYDIGTFDFGTTDSVVVLTRGERDLETLQKLSKFKLRYVGMLSSRRRVTENIAKLRALGVRDEFLGSLRAPAGADIGAITAAEIALSIVAEIVAGKYSKDVIHMAPKDGSKPAQIERRSR